MPPKKIKGRYVRDYYLVKVPGDLSDNIQDLGQAAIREAEERTKLYCIPCEWTATKIAGEIGDFEVTFRVRRTRYRRAS